MTIHTVKLDDGRFISIGNGFGWEKDNELGNSEVDRFSRAHGKLCVIDKQGNIFDDEHIKGISPHSNNQQ